MSGPLDDRREDLGLADRVTRLEMGQVNLADRLSEHLRASDSMHQDQRTLIAKLDQRADDQDVRYARLLAALVVIGGALQVLAPALRDIFRLPG